MADRAVFLQAEAAGLAPEVALVVVAAARVQAQVAPQRAHAADGGARHHAGGLGQDGRVRVHQRVRRQLGDGGQRAEDQGVALARDAAQPRHGLQVDDVPGLGQALAQVHHQVRAPGQVHRAGVLGGQRQRLVHRARVVHVEGVHRVGHRRASGNGAASRAAWRAPWALRAAWMAACTFSGERGSSVMRTPTAS